MQKKQWIIVGSLVGVILLLAPFFVVDTAQRPYVRIDRGSSRTDSREVTLYLLGPDDVKEMAISNDANFTDIDWEPYTSRKSWTLDYGRGTKRVYVRYKDADGDVSRTTYQDTIFLSIPENMDVDIEIETAEGTDELTTEQRTIYLDVTYSTGVEDMRIAERDDFAGVSWQPVRERVSYILSSGAGKKTIYVQFRDGNNKLKTRSESVTYIERAGAIEDRAVLQGQGSAVYYLGLRGRIHPFFNSQVYFSWFDDFDAVVPVSNAKLSQYPISTAVCMRAGTWLVKFSGLPQVYIPEPGCRLRPIYSEVEAYVLFGPQWAQRIATLPVYTRAAYRVVDQRLSDMQDSDEDRDRDGVSERVEAEYRTSDRDADSDDDGISDYEEIYFWFTDPVNPDTDGDSFLDGREILVGFSPLGNTRLARVPNATYRYAWGSVVRSPKTNKLYIVDQKGYYRYLGTRTNDARFTTNRLSARYIIDPPYDMEIAPVSQSAYPRSVEEIMYPFFSANDDLILPL